MPIRFIDEEPKGKIKFTEKKPGLLMDILKGLGAGLAEVPTALGEQLGRKIQAPVREFLGKEPLTEEQLTELYSKVKYDPQTIAGKVAKFGAGIAPYLLVPELAVPARAAKVAPLLRGIPGGAFAGLGESIKEKGISKELPKDIAIGSTIGAGAGVLGEVIKGAGVPAREVYERLTGRRAGTLEKVTRPGTEALGIAQKGTTEAEVSPIQQMGVDLLKNLRKSFKEIKTSRGKAVGEAKEKAFTLLSETPIDNAKKYSNVVDDYISKKGEFAGKASSIEDDLIEISNKIKKKETLTAKNMQEIMDRLDEDIIAYTPKERTRLSFGERQVVEVAKKMRKEIDDVLKTKLGDEYKDAKKLYSEIKKFETGEVLGAPTELERILSPAVKETQAITQLKGIGAPTKGTQTAQLQELEAVFKKAGFPTETLKSIDDYKAAIDFLQADITAGQGVLSFIPTMLRKGESPILPLIKKARSLDLKSIKKAAIAGTVKGAIQPLKGEVSYKHVVNPDGSTSKRNIDKIRQERGIR